jgi:hypothetical protein
VDRAPAAAPAAALAAVAAVAAAAILLRLLFCCGCSSRKMGQRSFKRLATSIIDENQCPSLLFKLVIKLI